MFTSSMCMLLNDTACTLYVHKIKLLTTNTYYTHLHSSWNLIQLTDNIIDELNDG